MQLGCHHGSPKKPYCFLRDHVCYSLMITLIISLHDHAYSFPHDHAYYFPSRSWHIHCVVFKNTYMTKDNPSGPDRQGSAETQGPAAGSNESHGHSKPSEPGM